jgi:hypothetical protein
VVREEISRKSVQDAFWLEPGVAYVKVLSFGETTGQELDQTLKNLGESGIKGLILDLRGNPGGLLNTGVEVAGHFLPKGSVIVSHHGRSSPEKTYVAETGNRGRNYAMVVLVDRMSASAAEIVSGALQDHDRALILGETTFGKGLVQTVYPLPERTALALTTAHFYTPSGRLIQRDYSQQTYFDYYNVRDEHARNPQDVKMTDSGRTVYGGGGITPDEVFKVQPMDRLQSQLFRNGLFAFTRNYFSSHSGRERVAARPRDARRLARLPVEEQLHLYRGGMGHGPGLGEALPGQGDVRLGLQQRRKRPRVRPFGSGSAPGCGSSARSRNAGGECPQGDRAEDGSKTAAQPVTGGGYAPVTIVT